MEIKYINAALDAHVYEFFGISKDRADQLIEHVKEVALRKNRFKSEDIRDICEKCDNIEEAAMCCYMLGKRSAMIYL